jgi:hypothetical protein
MSRFCPQLLKNSVKKSVMFPHEISLERSSTHDNAVLLNETTVNQGTSRQTKKGAKLWLRTPNEYSRTKIHFMSQSDDSLLYFPGFPTSVIGPEFDSRLDMSRNQVFLLVLRTKRNKINMK